MSVHLRLTECLVCDCKGVLQYAPTQVVVSSINPVNPLILKILIQTKKCQVKHNNPKFKIYHSLIHHYEKPPRRHTDVQ